MTIVHGCEPIDFFEPGFLPSLILYCGRGDADSLSTIQNVSIVVEEDVQFFFLLSYVSAFTVYQNINIISHASSFVITSFIYGYGSDIAMESMSITSTQPLIASDFVGLTGVVFNGSNTISNSFFTLPSLGDSGFITGFQDNSDSDLTLTNVYIYLSSQENIGDGAVFGGNDDNNTTTTLKNVNIIYNSYSEIQSITTPPLFRYNTTYTSVINYENVYTNIDNATIFNNNFGVVNGSAMTSFVWTSHPTFSTPNGFDSSLPNRLATFLTFPFNASSYPVFQNTALMLQSSTTRPDAIVRTQEGNRFLYRLVNPNAYAPIPKVITNEFIMKRNMAPNYIPSRTGYVV